MFEIPECTTLAMQMREHLAGKRIVDGSLGNSPHKVLMDHGLILPANIVKIYYQIFRILMKPSSY
jgi:hypothetical protein